MKDLLDKFLVLIYTYKVYKIKLAVKSLCLSYDLFIWMHDIPGFPLQEETADNILATSAYNKSIYT